MKIVFFGTPEIAVSSLEFFIQKEDIEVLAVVTQPDKPAGRGKKLTPSPVKLLAEQHGIEIVQPRLIRKDESLIEKLKLLEADFFVTVAFGQILSQGIIDIPKSGVINMHASLLPKYRGANPIQRAIVQGEKITGITTMLTDIGIDTGAMLLTKEIEISENMNSAELSAEISNLAPQLLYDTLIGFLNSTISTVSQDHEQATFAPKFKKEDGLIDWNDTAVNIHNKARGLFPWPSAYTFFKDFPVKIIETEVLEFENKLKSGEIVNISKDGIEVSTGEGTILIKKLQPQGKKIMEASSWCNGARVTIGDEFVSSSQNDI